MANTQVETYLELHAIHIEVKRSLVPMIGKGLSYLFGKATESDLNTICSCFSGLDKSQEEIAHVVNKNISVLGRLRILMSENRHVLNKIIGNIANLDVKLGNITQTLEKEVFQVEQFVQLYLQLDSIMQAIRGTVWQANLMCSMNSYN